MPAVVSLREDGFLIETLSQTDLYAYFDFLAGFSSIIFTADLATFDSLLGYGASLVETGGPEPFVQAYSAEWCLLVFDFFPLHVLLSTRSLLAGAGADRNLLPGETRRDREMVSDCRVA